MREDDLNGIENRLEVTEIHNRPEELPHSHLNDRKCDSSVFCIFIVGFFLRFFNVFIY